MMLYRLFRSFVLRLFRAPTEPPEAPAGNSASVQVFRASPKYLTLQFIPWGIGVVTTLGTLSTVVTAIAYAPDVPPALIAVMFGALVIVALIFLFSYFMIRLDYDMRYYVITDRSLRVRYGSLQINEDTYTYANVQNLHIHSGPIERMLGIANITIETAGGGGAKKGVGALADQHKGSICGISNAEAIRDQILALLKAYRDAGLGDTPARVANQGTETSGLSHNAEQRLREVRDELVAVRELITKKTPRARQ